MLKGNQKNKILGFYSASVVNVFANQTKACIQHGSEEKHPLRDIFLVFYVLLKAAQNYQSMTSNEPNFMSYSRI